MFCTAFVGTKSVGHTIINNFCCLSGCVVLCTRMCSPSAQVTDHCQLKLEQNKFMTLDTHGT